jgi:hypothetical protein
MVGIAMVNGKAKKRGDLPVISCGRAFRELKTLLGEIGSTAHFIM